jgi:manganese/zinc/iron transport system permease protein
MLMGLSAGLIGAIAVLRKESLIGEVLSHAAYPGIILGMVMASAMMLFQSDEAFPFFALFGGAITALLGIGAIHWLERYLRIPGDAALCFVLAATFGIGIALASHLQFVDVVAYRTALAMLYGQAATMTDVHIFIYAALAAVIFLALFLFYKEIQIITFDRQYAASLGIRVHWIEWILFALVTATVIVGIRSVGVILMSAMLIAPAVAARQFTDRLSLLLLISGLIGLVSAFLGNYISVEISQSMSQAYIGGRVSLPTGPMIALTASFFCLCSLLLAPQRGLLLRAWRIAQFKANCLQENILKAIWHLPNRCSAQRELIDYLGASQFSVGVVLRKLSKQGWIYRCEGGKWALTADGQARAAKIVRLHRLWEVYLADYLGVGAERVHYSAEEMEHIITPELERELTQLLRDPKVDPHSQPIPPTQVRW